MYQSSKNSNHSAELVYKERKRYEDYNNYQLNSIKKEFFSRIQIKQHEILNVKSAFEREVDKNEEMFKLENLYNERMKKMLENFSKNMNNLNDRNLKIAEEREEIIKNYIGLENKTYEAINKIMDENKKVIENKNIGIHAKDFENFVEKCINNINENLNKAAINNNQPKNITILVDNNSNNKPDPINQIQITSNPNIESINKNIFTTEIKNDINKIIDLNKEINDHNPFDNANEQIIIRNPNEKNRNDISNYNFILKFINLDFKNKEEINYNNITNPIPKKKADMNRASRDSLNILTSNDTMKKKKKPIHPTEIYNKILKSNSKNNLDNSQSQNNKSNMQNSNYFDEGKKNLLGDWNRENSKIKDKFENNQENKYRNPLKNSKKNNLNVQEIINENNNTNKSFDNNFIQISNNEKTVISKFTPLNNTEDYVLGKNISGITNEMLNQMNANHTINGNKIYEGI